MRTYDVNNNYRSWRGIRIVGWVLLGIVGAVALAFLFGYFVMLLWNFLMPSIFAVGEITFIQAVGIVILARLIFGGFKHGGHDRYSHRSKWKSRKSSHADCWGKWKYYDAYWKEEGEERFNEYVKKKENKEVQADQNEDK